MEAVTTGTGERRLPGEKAQRIVEAMRSSVARRGVAGSTFDHVAREAGVSRGLLHYYFGTKERLLAEVVRHDTEVRMTLLDEQLRDAATPDDVLERMVASLEDLVDREAELITLVFELFALSRDRKSTRLNSSHANISYAVFCLKKKKKTNHQP